MADSGNGDFFSFFWLCWVFVAVHRLFSSSGELELLFIAMCGLLIAVASVAGLKQLKQGSRHAGFSCSTQAQ